MTGDFTSVPLRPSGPRWLGARLQQGRVLLYGDWNLNVDADERERQNLAVTTIGPAGVLEGSSAFEVTFASDGSLQIGAGDMWVGGLCATNPAQLAYEAQEAIAALPETGNALVYLDAVVQEVQPAEDPELLDPALDGVDTVTRTRVAWRVRAVATDASSCSAAAADLPATLSTGRLDVVRTSPAMPADPCAPPDDPRGKLPDGLLRVEVLDSGSETTARFAWSYENGGAAVQARVAGTQVTLVPSPLTTFFPNDLVEVSRLVRRLDRLDNGPLFTAASVTPGAGGSVVTLSSPSSVTGTPSGLCLRRWDGQVVGAAAPVAALLAGTDVGIAFTARPCAYVAGDWWAVRVRGSAADAVETLTDAPPDGVQHEVAPLAVVDISGKTVLSDCRPAFVPLTQIRPGTCTVTAFPGDDLQAAADRLPDSGGELCLAAGTFQLGAPVTFTGKQRIVVTGVGPATVLAVRGHESVLQFLDCDDVMVVNLRAEAGLGTGASGRVGTQHLLGSLTFLGCSDVTVRDCELVCPDSAGRTQSAFYSAPSADNANARNRIVDNRLQVGDQQVGVLVVSCDETDVEGNEIRLGPDPAQIRLLPFVVREVARYLAAHVETVAAGGAPAPAATTDPVAKKAAAVPAARAKRASRARVADPAGAEAGATAAAAPGVEPPAATPAVATARVLHLPGGTTFALSGPPQVQHMADQFSTQVTAKAMSRLTARQGMEKFVRRSILAPESLALSRANERFLAGIKTSSRTMGQGIVVGGARAGLVRIRGNVVVNVVEGIHVGLGAAGNTTATAGDVTISDNLVQCAIPFFWNRSRHAIYVGSVDRLTIHDNCARLVRVGAASADVAAFVATPVEAVRLFGRVGAWVSVRGLSLTGPFHCGVRVTDTATSQPRVALRYVSDVLNSAASGPALQPIPFPYANDRCVP